VFRVAPFAETLPELSAASWQTLADVAPIDRVLAIAHASSVANDSIVASLWDGDRLRGLALAIAIEHRRERWLAVTRGFDIGKSVLVARDADALQVAGDLFAGLRDHARRSGFHRLVVAPHAVEQHAILASAERSGVRLLPATAYELRLPQPGTFEDYLARLNANRRNALRVDLKLLAADTFEFTTHSPPAPETLERSWPLHVDLLARKASPLRYRGNFLLELARRAPPGALSFVTCTAQQRLVGFVVGVHDGDACVFMTIAVAADVAAPIFHTIGAVWLRAVIDAGVRTLFLSQYSDTWKRRLGSTPIDCRYGFLAL
jgi:hypothetical protein